MTRRLGLRLGTTLLVVAMVVTLGAACVGPALAGASTKPGSTKLTANDHVTTTTYAFAPGGIPSMLPRPNTGTAPKSADDPGGWGQYAVFFGILASGVIIGGLVFLESHRKLKAIRLAEAAQPTPMASSTRNEPVAESSAK